MIRDDDSLYTEDDLVELGITRELIWGAREKGLIVPRRPGMRGYQFIGREVVKAVIALAPACPMKSKAERVEQYTTGGTKPKRKE